MLHGLHGSPMLSHCSWRDIARFLRYLGPAQEPGGKLCPKMLESPGEQTNLASSRGVFALATESLWRGLVMSQDIR